jgi:hypothetical protein
VSVAQCNQIRAALCPLLSAASSGLCVRCSVQPTKSGPCARCSVQPVQDSVSVAQCNQIRALCPLLSAASSGLCVRCSVQPNRATKSGLCARCSVQPVQDSVSAKHYLCYSKRYFYSYSKHIVHLYFLSGRCTRAHFALSTFAHFALSIFAHFPWPSLRTFFPLYIRVRYPLRSVE